MVRRPTIQRFLVKKVPYSALAMLVSLRGFGLTLICPSTYLEVWGLWADSAEVIHKLDMASLDMGGRVRGGELRRNELGPLQKRISGKTLAPGYPRDCL